MPEATSTPTPAPVLTELTWGEPTSVIFKTPQGDSNFLLLLRVTVLDQGGKHFPQRARFGAPQPSVTVRQLHHCIAKAVIDNI